MGNSQHPSLTAILISVSTNSLPLFGITQSLALYKSYPAAKALPLVGVFAWAESFFTSSGGEVERGGGGPGAFRTEEEGEDMSVLGRLGKGDVGRDGASCDGGGGVDMVHARMQKWWDALTRSIWGSPKP